LAGPASSVADIQDAGVDLLQWGERGVRSPLDRRQLCRFCLAGLCCPRGPIMPSWAAATVTAAAPKKRRRCQLISSDILIVSIGESPRWMVTQRISERERKSLHARTEKLDLELSIGDGFRLPDQLVETLFGTVPFPLLVNVDSVSRAWRLSIDQHAKSHGRSWRRWPMTNEDRGRESGT